MSPIINDAVPEMETMRPSSSSRNAIILGFVVVMVIFLGLVAWAATAPLARAVATYATLTIKGEKKKSSILKAG